MSQVRAPAAPETVGPPADFIEDPYCFEEGVILVQTDPHARALSVLRQRFVAYEAAHDLGFRVTSDLQVHHIPNEFLARTPYRQAREGGKLAFDIALWDVPRDTEPTATSLHWGAWGQLLFALEIVSAQSREADLVHKKQVCERLQAGEYWVLDPQDLAMTLRGWRLDTEGVFQPVQPNAQGAFPSHILQTVLQARAGNLEWWDDTLGHWFSIERQHHRQGQADLLADYVTRCTDTRCGSEFRDRLLQIPPANWPDITDLVQIIGATDDGDMEQRVQAIRNLLI